MNGRRTVYVAHQGATLRREGERLHLSARGKRLRSIHVPGLRQLVLMGNVVLTPSSIDLLLEHGVDTVMLGHHGRYRGRIVSSVSSNVRLRLAQYRQLSDEEGSVALARRIVEGKAANQRTLIMRHARRHGEGPRMREARRGIRLMLARLRMASSLEQVRGCEGAAASHYFRALGEMVRADGFHFEARNRRPPLDPVNALLSFGYTLLFNVVEGALAVVGLDPYLGALHSPEAGRPSLACDLIEEFRAPVVDALVLAVLNQGAVRPEGFEESGPGEPVYMKRETMRWFVTLFERRMGRPTHYPPTSQRLPWREVVLQQARALARHLLGESPYTPYRSR